MKFLTTIHVFFQKWRSSLCNGRREEKWMDVEEKNGRCWGFWVSDDAILAID